jgi:hypothetical protein
MASVGQLLLMLGSPHEGEVVAAARAIVRVPGRGGMTLHDLAARVDYDAMRKLHYALEHIESLTEWERNFVLSVEKQDHVTEKQEGVLDRIINKLTAQRA